MFNIIQKKGHTVLQETTFNGGKIDWMSDSQVELDTAKEFISQAKGDVLMAGLGLGFLVDKIKFDTLTIVEKEQEVIDLYKGKGKIIHGDIFDYKTKDKYDIIYLDIWANYFQDKTEDLKRLEFLKDNLKEGGQIVWWGKHEEL